MVRKSRLGFCWRHVYHHRLTGKQLIFFPLHVPLLTHIPFIAPPRDRRGELLQAGVPHLERLFVKKRRRTPAHLPPPILYLDSSHGLV